MTTVGECIAHFEQWFPPELAEDWDAVGLVTGRRSDLVRRIAFAVDITDATVDWAISESAQMLFVHHPLYLRGTTNVDGDSAKGALVHRAIQHGLAIFVAHTNGDIARPGVSDAIADLLGLVDTRPIRPHARAASLGIGRVGALAEPCDLLSFAQRVADAFPSARSGVRWAGDPRRMIRTAAVCGGAGDDLFEEVQADVYVTSDLRHHIASDYLARGRAALIDVPHAASEAAWLPAVAVRLEQACEDVSTSVYGTCTEPWDGVISR